MLGIVILNYISWDDTSKCIESIINSDILYSFRIYVVDNNSPNLPNDKVQSVLRDCHVTFFKNNENRGYSSGNNIGVKLALKDNCDLIIISNSDVIYKNNSINDLVESISKYEDVGILGPKILLNGVPQNYARYCKTGLKQKYFATTFLKFLWPAVGRGYYGLDKGHDIERYVHDVSGCCYIMTRNCAEKITPFDENTFLFEEELIIGIRAEKEGLKVLYYPKIEVIHNHSGSTKYVKAFSFTQFVRSEIYYSKRYLNVDKIKIFPLYIIRCISYLRWMILIKEFRNKYIFFIKETLAYFWKI